MMMGKMMKIMISLMEKKKWEFLRYIRDNLKKKK